jgi:hypothetical protein
MTTNISDVQSLVGEPKSHWIGNQWIPAEGSHLYTTDEIRIIFSQECTLFVGDSLQRRAADTLHLMLSTSSDDHVPDVQNEVFTDEYFRKKTHDRGFQRRRFKLNHSLSKNNNSKGMGCLDSDWRPLLADVNQFTQDYQNQTISGRYNDYTAVVVGSTIWDVVGDRRRQTSAQEVRRLVNDTIMQINKSISSSALIVWKASGWCKDCPWSPKEDVLNNGDNYKIYAANDQAQKTIEALNSSNFVFVDWAREVLPRSLGIHRLSSNDGNPYHYRLEPRLQFLQMLCEVYDQHHKQESLIQRQHAAISHYGNSTASNASISELYLNQQNSLLLLIVASWSFLASVHLCRRVRIRI